MAVSLHELANHPIYRRTQLSPQCRFLFLTNNKILDSTPLWHCYMCISCCCSFNSDAIIARSENSTPIDTEKARIRHMAGRLQQYKMFLSLFFNDFVHHLVIDWVFCGVWLADITLQWYKNLKDNCNTVMHITVVNWEFSKDGTGVHVLRIGASLEDTRSRRVALQ